MTTNHQAATKFPIDAVVFLLVTMLFGRLLQIPLVATMLRNGGPELWPDTRVQVVAIDILALAVFLSILFNRSWWAEGFAKRRFWIYVTWIGLVIWGLMFGHALLRRATHNTRITHDGAVQTEVAARFILDGKNPYAESYRGTALDGTSFTNVPDRLSLFTHYVYPPLVPIVAIPAVWFADRFHAYAELQFIFMAALVLPIVLLLQRTPRWTWRSYILLATLGNPLFVFYTAAGYNDMLMFGLLLAGAILLSEHRWKVSGLLIGFAIAAKQTSWFYLPLLAVLLYSWWQSGDPQTRRGIYRFAIVVILTTLVLYGPFLVTHPQAVIEDLVTFPSGTIVGSYPIGGSTIWQWLVLQDSRHYYWLTAPSQLVVSLVALLGFGFSFRLFRRQPTVGWWIMLSTGVIFAIGIVNRYNYENYISALALVFFMGWLIEYGKTYVQQT